MKGMDGVYKIVVKGCLEVFVTIKGNSPTDKEVVDWMKSDGFEITPLRQTKMKKHGLGQAKTASLDKILKHVGEVKAIEENEWAKAAKIVKDAKVLEESVKNAMGNGSAIGGSKSAIGGGSG
jgi:predicted CoA-binding protein